MEEFNMIHFRMVGMTYQDAPAFRKKMKQIKADLFQMGHMVRAPAIHNCPAMYGVIIATFELSHPLRTDDEVFLRLKYDWIEHAEIVEAMTQRDHLY